MNKPDPRDYVLKLLRIYTIIGGIQAEHELDELAQYFKQYHSDMIEWFESEKDNF